MVIRPDVELANISDVGCQREDNQDYFLYCEPQEEEVFRERGRLLLVADGMGAHRGGAVASLIAAEVMRDTFYNLPSTDPLDILLAGFEKAHQRIAEFASRDSGLAGMGTTCSAAIVKRGKLSYGHIGDSRLYLIRAAEAQLLTHDHTVAEQLCRAGEISSAEARVHEMRHVLTAALGADTAVAAEFADGSWQLQPDDILLMCSDGLHALVEAHEMESMTRKTSLYEASRALVDLAKTRGGPDNITVQLMRMRGTPQ
jgi:protein phosphatase